MKTEPATTTAARENHRMRFDFRLAPRLPPRTWAATCARVGFEAWPYGRSGASDLGTFGLSKEREAPKLCAWCRGGRRRGRRMAPKGRHEGERTY